MAASPQTTLRPLVAILEELATHPPPPVRGAPLDELRHLLEGAARTAVAGVPGILAGALLDESVVTRATFAVGGTMFMVGATAYALINPQGHFAGFLMPPFDKERVVQVLEVLGGRDH